MVASPASEAVTCKTRTRLETELAFLLKLLNLVDGGEGGIRTR